MKKEMQRTMISYPAQARTPRRLVWALAGALLVPLAGQAAPVAIADDPLFASASAAPNIMFLIDNSGSMSNIVPDAPYNPDATYDCPGTKLTGTTTVGLRVSYNGYPYIRWGSSNYDWATTTSGNGPNNYAKRCFDPAASYNAALYANAFNDASGTANDYSYYSGAYLDAQYSGNYLNWYFGADPATNTYGAQAADWGTSSAASPIRKRSGTQQRMEIAKEVITALTDSLSNVRAGVSTYNGSSGANILLGCKDIDSGTQRSDMKSQINGLSPSGSTPLAESLHQIGRYFVGEGGAVNPGNKTAPGVITNGQYDGNLTLHPNNESKKTAADDDSVFNVSPLYSTGVSKESPIAYFCQKNFVIIVSDGRPQSDQNIPAMLQDYDGDCVSASPPCGSYDQKPASKGYEYESAGSDFLDDVAMALYEVDLRPDINDLKGNPVVNNLSTYMIGFADDQVINDPLIKDTAVNGGGEFFVAANAAELKAAFEKATQSILDQIGTAASVSFNTGTLSANTYVYLSQFNSTKWTGNLLAYKLDSKTGNVGEALPDTAMSLLQGVTHSTRKVITHHPVNRTGIPFAWSSLAPAQQNDLRTNAGGTLDADTVGQARLDFIKGDRSNEGKGQNFRIRGSVLGDIVHGGPVYVGTPELNWPSSANFTASSGPLTYTEFRKAKKDRTPVVYVGANDGMLHGFHGSSLSEVLAYIPSFLSSTDTTKGLHYLTNPSYQHRYYVDMPASISDVILGGAWKTVLVGAVGGGGKGIFALDITDPDSFGASNVLWEFTSADDPDLGLTFSRPMIARLNNGKWGAIVGNGYNSTSEHAVLFVLYLDANLTDKTWNLGTDYIKISTSAGVTLGSEANGMSTPGVIDTNGDKVADRVYAGDLYGNLWAFDLSASNAGTWASAYKTGSKPSPLFSAGAGKAITAMPVVVKNKQVTDKTNNAPNVLVMFGTGRYLTHADKSSTTAQHFYGVWDSGTGKLTTASLVQQTYDVDTASTRVISDADVSYGSKYGWYVALSKSGERSVTDAVPRGGVVLFTTIIPSGDMCAYGGSSWLMALAYDNGGRPDMAVFDYNGDGTVDKNDLAGDKAVGGKKLGNDGLAAAPKCLGNKCYIPTSSTTGGDKIEDIEVEDLGGLGTGRISWHEMIQ